MASGTLIVLNPHAGSGRAGRVWKELEPLLWDELGDLTIAVTQRPEDVADHLDRAYQSGFSRVISIGGDGTNHALVNAMVDLSESQPDRPRMIYGNLPIGSGRDWARAQHIPLDIREAARWISRAEPRPIDLGILQNGDQRVHFLNIASAGLSGEVDRRVNMMQRRWPWTFLKATVSTIVQHRPEAMRIWLDGQQWYEGPAYLVAVANGTTFGHGMRIAPHARTDDGLFDVVLVKGASRLTILKALYRVYNATHLTHPAVRHAQAHTVEIRAVDAPLGLDLDGESGEGRELHFSVAPAAIDMLSTPPAPTT